MMTTLSSKHFVWLMNYYNNIGEYLRV